MAAEGSHLSPGVIVAESAHITARACWLYPEDDEARMHAVEACAIAGVDYIGAVAAMMEATGCDADMARYHVAESWRRAAERLRANP